MPDAVEGSSGTDSVSEAVESATSGCKKGESNSGKNALGLVWTLLALGVAGYSVASALNTSTKQFDIAKRYLEISEWWRDYYNSVFAPWEDKELEEIQELLDEEPEYDVAIGRTRTAARLRFKGLDYQNIRCTSEYCTGLRAALLKDAALAEATATAALSNLGRQNEQAWIAARNDLRWKKILAVINRGRDMIAENVRFTSLAFGIFGDLTKQAAASAGGAMGFFGYALNRKETQYPVLASQMVTRPQGTDPQPVSAPTPVAQPVRRSGTFINPETGENEPVIGPLE